MLVICVLVLAGLGPFVAPHDPDTQFPDGLDATGAPRGPSAAHWLGTDTLGRDELSRLLHGGMLSLSVALAATAIAVALGLAIGVTAGYRRGAFDRIAMQVADVTQSIPFLLLAIAVNKVVDRPEVSTLAILLGLLSWTTLARITRAKTWQVRELEYVQAARALGMGGARIVLRHVLPNVLGPAIVIGTTLVAQMILVESAMSFLGVGVQPPTATWGSLLRDGEEMMSVSPRLVLYPGLVIVLTVFGFNLVGEGLRDALDPKDAVSAASTGSERAMGATAFVALAAMAVGAFVWMPPVPTHPAFLGAGASDETPTHGGTFVFWHESDVRGLDPAVSYDELSGMGMKLLFEGLIDYDDQLHFVPRLARELPTVSDDGLVYTFRLRTGVQFHNGRELEAEDVRWSMEHMLAPSTHSPGVDFYSRLAGYEAYRSGESAHVSGIEVLDRYTVRFRLAAADQTFLNAMAMLFAYPVPRENYEAHPDDVARHPVGTGAFELESWEPGVRLTFRRNPRFFIPGQPYCDRMVYEVNLDRRTAYMRFLAGDVDTIHRQSSTDYLQFRTLEAWRAYWEEAPVLDMFGVGMNSELAPFDDVHVRRAVAFAIDRDRWRRARANRFVVNGLPLPPGLGEFTEGVEPHHLDLERARAEMALAGHPVHQEGERWIAEGIDPTPIEFWLTEGDTGRVYGALLQQDLAQIGLSVEVRQVSFPVWLEETGHRRTVPMALMGWSADFPDPSNFLDVLFHSRSIHETASENRAFFHDADVDRMLDDAHGEPDAQRRRERYRDAVRRIVDQAPWAFVLTDLKLYAWQPYVRGYVPHPVWDQMYRDVWLDLPRRRSTLAFLRGPEGPSGVASLGPFLTAPLGRRH